MVAQQQVVLEIRKSAPKVGYLLSYICMCCAGEKPDSRSFGPFTPLLEAWTGRVAMLGFSGLLLVELLKGNNPVF